MDKAYDQILSEIISLSEDIKRREVNLNDRLILLGFSVNTSAKISALLESAMASNDKPDDSAVKNMQDLSNLEWSCVVGKCFRLLHGKSCRYLVVESGARSFSGTVLDMDEAGHEIISYGTEDGLDAYECVFRCMDVIRFLLLGDVVSREEYCSFLAVAASRVCSMLDEMRISHEC